MREELTQKQIEQAIGDLKCVIADLNSALEVMKSYEQDSILCHAQNVMNRRLPELMAWGGRIKCEAENHCRSIATNRKPHSVFMKERAAREAAKEQARRRRKKDPPGE